MAVSTASAALTSPASVAGAVEQLAPLLGCSLLDALAESLLLGAQRVGLADRPAARGVGREEGVDEPGALPPGPL